MSARRAFVLRHFGPLLPVVLFLLGLERTSLDTRVSSWFFDPVAGAFPLRYNAFVETVGHHFMKELVVVVCFCVIGLYLLSFLLAELRPYRRLLLFLSLALVLAPLAVVLLKMLSARHCPWDLKEYGGFAPHLSLFDMGFPARTGGHCFPGGHASAGFALLAFYFVGHAVGSRLCALAGLLGGLAAGTGFGMVRVAQGAHFLSHNLWSAVVCWLVVAVVYITVMGGQSVPSGSRTLPVRAVIAK